MLLVWSDDVDNNADTVPTAKSLILKETLGDVECHKLTKVTHNVTS